MNEDPANSPGGIVIVHVGSALLPYRKVRNET